MNGSASALRNNAPEPMGGRRGRCKVNTPRIKRQYVWEKTGGLCWYCGARLYYREEADTEIKKRLIFTADHLHPRAHGGRGRANKVPACKYCNSHKSSRSVEQFRQWVHALVFDKAKGDGAPFGKQRLGHWKIKAGAVVFYFELARLSNSGSQPLCKSRVSRMTLSTTDPKKT
jgi:hypothetical protein